MIRHVMQRKWLREEVTVRCRPAGSGFTPGIRSRDTLTWSASLLVAVSLLVILIPSVYPVSAQGVSPYDTPGFIAGTPIPVKSCSEEGARCIGGTDCISGICVDPCKGRTNPFCACDCVLPGPEQEFPWVVVVGGIAAVAAAAAIISQILKKKPKKKGQPEPEFYILQLSRNTLTVGPDHPGTFTATAWKVTEKGGTIPAPSASIHVLIPPDVTGLNVTPSLGSGSLASVVSVDQYSGPESVELTVTATGGGGRISATVRLTIEAGAEIEFD